MLLALFAAMSLAVASSFGVTYLALRRTALGPFSLLVSLVSFQPLMILSVTLLGYVMPVPLSPIRVWLPIAAGMAATLWVVLRERTDIAATFLGTWKTTFLIGGLVVASMVLATPVLLTRMGLGYIDWWNGELVNYSYLAHGFLGLLKDPNYLPGFVENTAVRYGAELFLAMLSIISGKAPLMIVCALSAFHKSAAIIAFGVGAQLLRRERGLGAAAVAVGTAGFAFATILSLNHVLAFLAAQSVTASFILISLVLLTQAINDRRVQVFLALHVLFIVITYAEALPFLLGLAGLAGIEALITRRWRTVSGLVVVFGLAFLLDPIILAQRVGYMYRLRMVIAGFNVLGSPNEGLIDYLGSALGFQYRFANVPPVPHAWLAMAVWCGLFAIVSSFLAASIRLRTATFIVVPVLLILIHLDFGVGVGVHQPGQTAFYKSYKAIAQLYFYAFIALSVLLDALFRPGRRRWILNVGRAATGVAVLVFIVGNMAVSVRAAAFLRSIPSIYWESDVRLALPPDGSAQPAVILATDIGASFWDLLAAFYHSPRILLNREQAEAIYHNHAPTIVEPTVLLAPETAKVLKQPETVFSGRVIVSTVSNYSPVPQPLDVPHVLESALPGLRLQESRRVMTTPAFRVLDGALLNTGGPPAGPDGTTNQMPVILGLTPSQGEGSEAVLRFAYADPNGASDIFGALFNISTGQSTYECYVSYNRAANQLGLELDGTHRWAVTTVGSGPVIENSRCSVDGTRSSAGESGREFTVQLAMKFKPAAAGRKTIFTTVEDRAHLTTGWQVAGYWTVR